MRADSCEKTSWMVASSGSSVGGVGSAGDPGGFLLDMSFLRGSALVRTRSGPTPAPTTSITSLKECSLDQHKPHPGRSPRDWLVQGRLTIGPSWADTCLLQANM